MDEILDISPAYQTEANKKPVMLSQVASQNSIIPLRKRVKTIPLKASQHEIILHPENIEEEEKQIEITKIPKSSQISLGEGVRRSQRLQNSQRSQRSDLNDELFKKSQDINITQNFQLSLNRFSDFEQPKNSQTNLKKDLKASNLIFKNSQSNISLGSLDQPKFHPSQFLKSNLNPTNKSILKFNPSLGTQKQFSQLFNNFGISQPNVTQNINGGNN